MLHKHHSQPCWGMLSQHFLAFSVQKTNDIKQMQRRVILLADRWYLFSTRLVLFHPSSSKINLHTSYEVFIALTNYVASKIQVFEHWYINEVTMKLIRLCQKIKAVFVVRRIGKPQCTMSTNYSFLCIIAVFFCFGGILHVMKLMTIVIGIAQCLYKKKWGLIEVLKCSHCLIVPAGIAW